MSEKKRLDRLLVDRGLFDSRSAAQAAITAGNVRVSGEVARRAADLVAVDSEIFATAPHPYVSRAALKLAHALDVFSIDPSGRHCLDIGASTGGFTEVLLERGAAHVTAVDVGRDQFHPRLRGDARITLLESTDARELTPAHFVTPPDLVVCDASFIGLEKILPVPLSLAAPRAELVLLFKPQFQVGPAHVGKGGIVKDKRASDEAEARFVDWLCEQGFSLRGRADSPIAGGDGNRERLIHASS